jgi:hypothetical protein
MVTAPVSSASSPSSPTTSWQPESREQRTPRIVLSVLSRERFQVEAASVQGELPIWYPGPCVWIAVEFNPVLARVPLGTTLRSPHHLMRRRGRCPLRSRGVERRPVRLWWGREWPCGTAPVVPGGGGDPLRLSQVLSPMWW